MIGFFIALLSGALMSVQGVFNTQVTKTTGMWVSNGWVQLSAFAVCIAAWFIAGRDGSGLAGLALVKSLGSWNRRWRPMTGRKIHKRNIRWKR